MKNNAPPQTWQSLSLLSFPLCTWVCVRAFGASDLFFPLSDAPGRRINHDVGGKEGEANQTLPLFRFCSRRTARESKKVSRIIRLSSAGLFSLLFPFFTGVCVCSLSVVLCVF